jgi:hypothetical protein
MHIATISRVLVMSALATIAGVATAATGSANPGDYVITQSGKVQCVVLYERVVCQANSPQSPTGFLQAPSSDFAGGHWRIANVDAAGNFAWDPNYGIQGSVRRNPLVMNYGQTYNIQGWTIAPSEVGTRFTNQATGHGMFVSIENVFAF